MMTPHADPSFAVVDTSVKKQEASTPQQDVRVSPELLDILLAKVNRSDTAVSADVFNSLLAKVNRLDDTVSKLQNDNVELRQELSVLRQNSGGAFTLFPKLPPELRR